MVKKISRIIIVIILLCIGEVCSSDAQVTTVGGSADGTLPQPTGICGGTFSMTSDGFFSTALDSAQIDIAVGPLEGAYAGKLYIILGNTTAQTSQLYKVSANTLTQDNVQTIDAATNNPDIVSAGHQLVYDLNTAKLNLIGSTSATTCNGGLNSCLHWRQYNGGTPGSDIVTSSILENASPGVLFKATYDISGRYWVPYRTTPAGTQLLGEYSGFVLMKTATLTATSNFIQGTGNDNEYVYATQNIGPSIIRLPKGNIAVGAITFSPGFAGGNSLQPLTVDVDAGFIYQPSRGTGVTSNFVYKVQTSNMTITGTSTFGTTQFMGKVLVDNVNNKLYVAIASNNTTNQLVRMNRSTFVVEATFNGGSSAGGAIVNSAQIDIPHQKIYMPLAGTGGGGVARVEKINLCL